MSLYLIFVNLLLITETFFCSFTFKLSLIIDISKKLGNSLNSLIIALQVIDRSMPVFNKQFYSDSVPENIELHSPLSVAIQAESPLGRKLIYSIVKGNELELFAVDFNTGMLILCLLCRATRHFDNFW